MLTGGRRDGAAVVVGGVAFAGYCFAVAGPLPGSPIVAGVTAGSTVSDSVSTAGKVTTFVLTATTPYPTGLPLYPNGVQISVAYATRLQTTAEAGVTVGYTDQVNSTVTDSP